MVENRSTYGRIPTREQIEKRAHEIYVRRGGDYGHDLDDWLAAEQQLQQEMRYWT